MISDSLLAFQTQIHIQAKGFGSQPFIQGTLYIDNCGYSFKSILNSQGLSLRTIIVHIMHMLLCCIAEAVVLHK